MTRSFSVPAFEFRASLLPQVRQELFAPAQALRRSSLIAVLFVQALRNDALHASHDGYQVINHRCLVVCGAENDARPTRQCGESICLPREALKRTAYQKRR